MKKIEGGLTVCKKHLTTMVGQVEKFYLSAGMDNVNCKHKQIFVKELFKVNTPSAKESITPPPRYHMILTKIFISKPATWALVRGLWTFGICTPGTWNMAPDTWNLHT